MNFVEMIFGDLKVQDVVMLMAMLIFLYLLLANWKGANSLLATGASASIGMVKTLQGR
jgi:hypothetical protein